MSDDLSNEDIQLEFMKPGQPIKFNQMNSIQVVKC